MKDTLVYVAGQRTFEEIPATLASGTKTVATILTKWRPWGIVELGNGSGESFGITNTADADGWYHGSPVIDSNNGSSTAAVLLILSGY